MDNNQITSKDLAAIVNYKDSEPKVTDMPLDEARFPIRVTNEIFDRFVKAAQFHNYPSVEAWATSLLVNSLTQKVGAKTISAPTEMSGKPQQSTLITGPKGGIVSRG